MPPPLGLPALPAPAPGAGEPSCAAPRPPYSPASLSLQTLIFSNYPASGTRRISQPSTAIGKLSPPLGRVKPTPLTSEKAFSSFAFAAFALISVCVVFLDFYLSSCLWSKALRTVLFRPVPQFQPFAVIALPSPMLPLEAYTTAKIDWNCIPCHGTSVLKCDNHPPHHQEAPNRNSWNHFCASTTVQPYTPPICMDKARNSTSI